MTAKISQFIHRHSPSIVAGIFIGTSYIPFPPWASLFCFVPLWWRWFQIANLNFSTADTRSEAALPPRISDTTNPYRKVFFAGWLTQFLFTLIGFNWVALTVHEFGLMPWPVAITTLLAFCSIANLDVPLAGVFWLYLQKRFRLSAHQSLALLGVLYALFESWVPTLFPWNYGYTWLWANAPIAQLGELIGFQGLSGIVVLFNCLSFLIFMKWRKSGWAGARRLVTATLVTFITLHLAGWGLRKSLPQPDSSLNVMLVQANIGNLQKQAAEQGWGFREHITEKYSSISRDGRQRTQAAGQNIDFIVWPETAYPYELDQRFWSTDDSSTTFGHKPPLPIAAETLVRLTTELDTHLITGGYGYAPKDDKVTNTFFIFEKSLGPQPHPYFKTILLAFGEYIPGADYFPKIRQWIPAGDFSRGAGPAVQTLGDFRIGPQICYESLFPTFSGALADQGAQIFVNLTNDSWYGTWQEPYQHLFMTLARAVEYRRPLIRATNTGISTVALATGEVLEQSPMNVEWSHTYNVPYIKNPPPTLYQKWPWLIDILLAAMIVLILGRAAIERTQKP